MRSAVLEQVGRRAVSVNTGSHGVAFEIETSTPDGARIAAPPTQPEQPARAPKGAALSGWSHVEPQGVSSDELSSPVASSLRLRLRMRLALAAYGCGAGGTSDRSTDLAE
jgi:hypothetical protein